jgi:hypothetical protein
MELDSKKAFSLNPLDLQRVFYLMHHIDSSQKLTFLDFGGSDGSTAQQIQELFPLINAYVCDSIRYKKCWDRRKILYKELDEFSDSSIDIFYSAHSLEHFNANELHDLMGKIKKKCKEGALLYLEVPNEDFYGSMENISYNPGPHISHFNKKSFEYLIGEHFDIISSTTRGLENRYGLQKKVKLGSENKGGGRAVHLKKFIKIILRKLKIINFMYRISYKINELFNLDKSIAQFANYGYFNLNDQGDLLVIIAQKK